MKILRAEHLGMCFGVRDAIALALETGRQRNRSRSWATWSTTKLCWPNCAPRGIRIAQQARGGGDAGTVMITAHGASEQAIGEARERGLRVLEATCPLVQLAHRAVASWSARVFTRSSSASATTSRCAG